MVKKTKMPEFQVVKLKFILNKGHFFNKFT